MGIQHPQPARELQISRDSRIGMRGTILVYLSFPKSCFLFQLFQVEWKTRIVSFLENYSSNSRIICASKVRQLSKEHAE